jgi:uncharacterized protein (TIGR03435 family)
MRYRTRIVIMAVILASLTAITSAQNQPLTFEVASVRPNASGINRWTFGVQRSGRVFVTNTPLREIIAFAYSIDAVNERFILIGGTEKLLESRFDIQAIPPNHQDDQPPRKEDSLLMLRALLAEWFGLRMRKETRQVPTYVLTVAKPPKLGPHLHRSENDCVTVKAKLRTDPSLVPPPDFDGKHLCVTPYFAFPKPGVITLKEAGPIETFVTHLQAYSDRKIFNKTGLTGNFEWSITFSRNLSDLETPPLSIAAQSELGLRLEEQNRPAEVFVIDALTTPTEN